MPTPSPRAIAARWRDGGPGTIVATAASAWWQHWPALIAIVLDRRSHRRTRPVQVEHADVGDPYDPDAEQPQPAQQGEATP